MSKNKQRKPHPAPPKWYWWDTDNCWACKNRNGCSNCKFLKSYVAQQKEKQKRKEKILIDFS